MPQINDNQDGSLSLDISAASGDFAGGLNEKNNRAPNESPKLLNVYADSDMNIVPAPKWVNLSPGRTIQDDSGAEIVGIKRAFSFMALDGLEYLIITDNESVWYSTTKNAFTKIPDVAGTGDLTFDNSFSLRLASYNKKLYMVSADIYPHIWDPTTNTTTEYSTWKDTGTATTELKGRFITVHGGKLWIGNSISTPERVYMSDINGDFYAIDFVGPSSLRSGSVTGLCSSRYGLLVFKFDSEFLIAGDSMDNYVTQSLGNDGCINADSICDVDGTIVYLSHKGFRITDGLRTAPLSEKINHTLSKLCQPLSYYSIGYQLRDADLSSGTFSFSLLTSANDGSLARLIPSANWYIAKGFQTYLRTDWAAKLSSASGGASPAMLPAENGIEWHWKNGTQNTTAIQNGTEDADPGYAPKLFFIVIREWLEDPLNDGEGEVGSIIYWGKKGFVGLVGTDPDSADVIWNDVGSPDIYDLMQQNKYFCSNPNETGTYYNNSYHFTHNNKDHNNKRVVVEIHIKHPDDYLRMPDTRTYWGYHPNETVLRGMPFILPTYETTDINLSLTWSWEKTYGSSGDSDYGYGLRFTDIRCQGGFVFNSYLSPIIKLGKAYGFNSFSLLSNGSNWELDKFLTDKGEDPVSWVYKIEVEFIGVDSLGNVVSTGFLDFQNTGYGVAPFVNRTLQDLYLNEAVANYDFTYATKIQFSFEIGLDGTNIGGVMTSRPFYFQGLYIEYYIDQVDSIDKTIHNMSSVKWEDKYLLAFTRNGDGANNHILVIDNLLDNQQGSRYWKWRKANNAFMIPLGKEVICIEDSGATSSQIKTITTDYLTQYEDADLPVYYETDDIGIPEGIFKRYSKVNIYREIFDFLNNEPLLLLAGINKNINIEIWLDGKYAGTIENMFQQEYSDLMTHSTLRIYETPYTPYPAEPSIIYMGTDTEERGVLGFGHTMKLKIYWHPEPHSRGITRFIHHALLKNLRFTIFPQPFEFVNTNIDVRTGLW